MLKRLGAAALLVMSVVGVAGVPAGAVTPPTPPAVPELQCGVVVTTSVQLTQDLTCAGQVVTGSDSATAITIDLNGHTLRGPTPPGQPCALNFISSCAIEALGGPVTVRNGTVNGGIIFPQAGVGTGSSGGTIDRVTVNGAVILNGPTQSVTHTIVNGTLMGSVSQTFETTDTVSDSGVNGGIQFDNRFQSDKPSHVTVRHNTVLGGGITTTTALPSGPVDDTIDANTVGGAFDVGIKVSANTGISTTHSVKASVTNNVVTNAGSQGIRILDLGGLDTSTVSGNTVSGSGTTGIELVAFELLQQNDPRILTLTSNTANDNGGNGILVGEDDALFVVSGTTNRATGNLTDPQCVRVSCAPGAPAVPPVRWPNTPLIHYPTPLGAAELNAESLVPGTFTYDPPAGTVLDPNGGTADGHSDPQHVLTATFVPTDTSTYQTVSLQRSLDVQGGQSFITWDTPADITYGTLLGPDQLNATTPVPGTFTYTPPVGTRLSPGPHSLNVSFSPADPAHYQVGFAGVTINVLVPPGESVTWNNPPDLLLGTPLGPDQLNATATVPGTFAYTPTAGTLLGVGTNQVLTAVFTPDDLAHFAPITTTVHVNVVTPPVAVNWTPPAPINYGARLTRNQLNATATVPGTFTYTPQPGVVLDPGVQTLSVLFRPTDSVHFVPITTTVPITVKPPKVMPTDPFQFPQPTSGVFPSRADTVDLNGDGKPDMVMTDTKSTIFGFTAGSATLRVALGHGDGNFGPATTYPIGTGTHGLAIKDVNGDGKLDVLATNGADNTLSVLLGNGDATFGPTTTYPVGINPGSIVVSDFDGDGRVDAAVVNFMSNSVSVLRGTATGFAPRVDYPTGNLPAGLIGRDLDGDGHLDLITSNLGGNSISVLRGTGMTTGTFAPKVDQHTCRLPGAFAAGDINEDGHVDLAILCTDLGFGIFYGDGAGGFKFRASYGAGQKALDLALGDLNGDGHLDLVAGTILNIPVTLRFGSANGIFSPPLLVTISNAQGTFAIVDVNGDGRNDLLGCNPLGNIVMVYLSKPPGH